LARVPRRFTRARVEGAKTVGVGMSRAACPRVATHPASVACE